MMGSDPGGSTDWIRVRERTVVVADDNRTLRVLIRTMLHRHAGWSVLEAEDGHRALSVAKPGPVDLFILDQRMPGRTGTEVASALREQGFVGPIVLFSAYLDREVERDAERLQLISVAKSDIGQLAAIASEALADDA